MKKTMAILISCMLVLGVFAGCSSKKGAAPSAVGSYTEDRELTQEDRDLFEKVLSSMDTTKTYEPLMVATQVVSGTNYRFKVKVNDNGTTYESHFVIYQPLEGDAKFVSEEKIQ